MANELDTHRHEIDLIDNELLALLNERAKHAMAIGALKKHNGQQSVIDNQREAAIFARLTSKNKGPLTNKQVLTCFDLFIEQSRNLQESL